MHPQCDSSNDGRRLAPAPSSVTVANAPMVVRLGAPGNVNVLAAVYDPSTTRERVAGNLAQGADDVKLAARNLYRATIGYAPLNTLSHRHS